MLKKVILDSLFCALVGPFIGLLAFILIFASIGDELVTKMKLYEFPLALISSYMLGFIPAFFGGLLFSVLTQRRLAALTRTKYAITGAICGGLSLLVFSIGFLFYIYLTDRYGKFFVFEELWNNALAFVPFLGVAIISGLCTAWILWGRQKRGPSARSITDIYL